MLIIMKKIPFHYNKLMTGLLLVAAMASSCKRLIDIPANPPTAITEAQQFADSATTMTAIAGIYTYPTGSGNGTFTFNNGYLSLYTGLSSDELLPTTTSAPEDLQFYSNSITAFNGILNTLWSDPYKGLYPVNAALKDITASSGLSASLKKQLTGEMKVVRALYYFYLVNLFGDVPLVTSTDYNATAMIPRTSVGSIYGQILTDLTEAQQALPTDYPSAGRVRPNLYTVDAFLSKVYLYRQEWQKAYDAASTVIGSGEYNLEPDLNNVFLDGSQEAIWQLPANSQDGATTEARHFLPNYGSPARYLMTPALLSAFESGDIRLQKWAKQTVINIGGTNQTLSYPYKYKNINASAPTVEDFMIFRLGELYLIRAEAATELGNTTAALADLNAVRVRAGLGASTAASQADVLSAIIHERQTELFTEWGSRWLDLKRTGTMNAVLGAAKPGWNAKDTLYPVPYPQIQVDNLLTQNPGY